MMCGSAVNWYTGCPCRIPEKAAAQGVFAVALNCTLITTVTMGVAESTKTATLRISFLSVTDYTHSFRLGWDRRWSKRDIWTGYCSKRTGDWVRQGCCCTTAIVNASNPLTQRRFWDLPSQVIQPQLLIRNVRLVEGWLWVCAIHELREKVLVFPHVWRDAVRGQKRPIST